MIKTLKRVFTFQALVLALALGMALITLTILAAVAHAQPPSIVRSSQVVSGTSAYYEVLDTPSLNSDASGTTLTQNLRTNGNWISGDGDDEGLFVDANGTCQLWTTTGSYIYFENYNNGSLRISPGMGSSTTNKIYLIGTVLAYSDDTHNLGDASFRWKKLYLGSGGLEMTSGTTIMWGSSGPGFHGTATDVYAFNSSGTDTKLSSHDKYDRLIKYSYNVWTGEGKLIEIERFFDDITAGAAARKSIARVIRESGPYVHTDWDEITEITGLPRPPRRDWFKHQRALQRRAFRRKWIAENTVSIDGTPAPPDASAVASAVSAFKPDEAAIAARFKKLPAWLRKKLKP